MEDNKDTLKSKIQEGTSGNITWILENWKNWHEMLAKEADCTLNINDVKLRFFFGHFTKNIDRTTYNPATRIDYYSLCVQLLSCQKHVCLKVTTEYNKRKGNGYSHGEPWGTGLYYVSVKKSATNQDGIEIIDPEFFKRAILHMNYRDGDVRNDGGSDFDSDSEDLRIKLTVTLCQYIIEVNSISKSLVDSEVKNGNNLIAAQLQRVLHNHPEKPFADISLQMQDNVTLQCHRLILAGASPMFEAMFTSGLKEAQTGIVRIPDVSSEVMKILIKFMYTGKVDSPPSQLMEQVIYAAKKYQLSGLVEICENFLITNCNPGNALGLLKIASKYDLQNASSELQKYTEIHALDIVMDQIKKAEKQ